MSIKNRIKELADSHHQSIAEVERHLSFGNGTIAKWDTRSPSSEKLQKVADYFHVSTDYLLGRTNTPQFTRKDERDVQKILTDMTEGLSNESSLAYMKNGGEEIDEEDAELLRASLENVIRQSKLIAKQKFTPKKYRKDKD
ncbi:transcriptional regulator [Limosilactobacillus vaginalis]|uniref:helix-turn-helix domain-containing protein n=1 Tax=Limosilactobacillus vaginalis TaxID=1633 RepID=UPI003F1EBEA2